MTENCFKIINKVLFFQTNLSLLKICRHLLDEIFNFFPGMHLLFFFLKSPECIQYEIILMLIQFLSSVNIQFTLFAKVLKIVIKCELIMLTYFVAFQKIQSSQFFCYVSNDERPFILKLNSFEIFECNLELTVFFFLFQHN